jgi:ribosomal RNA-processing protein 9
MGAIDCVKFVNDEIFVSGAADGSLSLWNVDKKKPIHVVTYAHGVNQAILSIATLPYTDLVASGSTDGYVRLWKIEALSSLREILTVAVCGFVNALSFSASGNYLIAGIGQEHRLGRWMKLKPVKNAVHIILLKNAREK